MSQSTERLLQGIILLGIFFLGFLFRKMYDSYRADRAWQRVWQEEQRKAPRANR